MWQDPIVAEVRHVREAHAAQYEFDLKAIYRALKEAERAGRQKRVSFPPKRLEPTKEMDEALAA